MREYCPDCGERRAGARDRSILHFLRDAASEFTSADTKLLRTFRRLLFKPGELTREFMDGRRVPYVRPIQLFLIANLVYFVVQPFTLYSGYNTPLQSQTQRQFYSEAAGLKQVVEADIARRGIPAESYEALYNAKSEMYAKSLVLLMVPLFAFVIELLHLKKRRPLLDHLVFAIHYYAWELLFVSSFFLVLYSRLLLPMLMDAYHAAGLTQESAVGGAAWLFVAEMPTAPLVVLYLAFAFRRHYTDSWGGAWLRAVACVPLLLLLTIVYRFLLFWITYASM